MRKLKTFQVFLETQESDVPNESLVKLDSVGCVLGEYSGTLWPEMKDGSVDWESGIQWEDTDWSFRQEMSAEDRTKMDAAMVSAEEYFGGRVDMSLMDYLSDVIVAEELTDTGYQVTIQAAVWNHTGGQSYFSSGASLPTVFMRVMEEGRTEDEWIRDFRRNMKRLKSNFASYGIGYVVTFHMGGGSVSRIPDELADAVKERVAEEFPGAYLQIRQDVRTRPLSWFN